MTVSNKWLSPFCLAALAFAIRFVFALQWAGTPYGGAPLLDAQVYDEWAQHLAAGVADQGVYYQSPLYPWLLSFLYRLVGHSLLAASVLNAFLDAGTTVLIFLITERVFGCVAAIIAGILVALCAPMIFYSAPPMKEPLCLFLLAGYVWISLNALSHRRMIWFGLSGLLFGLVVLTRGNALLLLPLLPVLAWRQEKLKPAFCAIYFVGFMAALTPVTLHNWQAAHDFVPIGYDDGFNLYIGHSSYANGTNTYPPEVSTGPAQERIDTGFIAEQVVGHALKPSGISAYWRGRAVDFAVHHPGREMVLLAHKIFAFWNGADSFDNYDVAFIKQNFPTLLNAPLSGFVLVACLAVFSLLAGVGQQNKPARDFLLWAAVIYMLSVLVFYVTDRYRLPVIIFLFPFAGAALPQLVLLIQKNERKKIASCLVLAHLLLFISYLPLLDKTDLTAFDWGVLTGIYADKHEGEAALDAFHRAVAVSPQEAGVQTYIRAADIYEDWGQVTRAEEILMDATHIFPNDGVAYYNFGRWQAAHGDIDAALMTMERARDLTPTYVLTYYALARLYERKADPNAAREAVQQGLAIDPGDTRLRELANTRNLMW